MKITIGGIKMSWEAATAINFGYKIIRWGDVYKINGRLRDSIGFNWISLWVQLVKSKILIIP